MAFNNNVLVYTVYKTHTHTNKVNKSGKKLIKFLLNSWLYETLNEWIILDRKKPLTTYSSTYLACFLFVGSAQYAY